MAAASDSKQPRSVNRHLYDHIALVAIIVGLSAALTYIEIAGVPGTASLFKPASPKPAATTPQPAPAPTVKPIAVPTPAVAVPAPVPAPPPPAAKPTATTVSFVHMRAAKTTASPILADLDAGTTVELTEDANPSWQGVIYQGQKGYIFKSYLQY